MMNLRIILLLVCVTSSIHLSSHAQRAGHGKKVLCYFWPAESYNPNLQVDPILKSTCTHFILDSFAIDRNTFDLMVTFKSIRITEWQMNMHRFSHLNILLEVYWSDISRSHLSRMPRDLGATWAKFLKDNQFSGILFRFYNSAYYQNKPYDIYFNAVLNRVYDDLHNNNLLVIVDDFKCLYRSTVNAIKADYVISSCDMTTPACSNRHHIPTNHDYQFTDFNNIPNSKIIKQFEFQFKIHNRFYTKNTDYLEVCKKVIKTHTPYSLLPDNCMKLSYIEIGNGQSRDVTLDDTHTVYKKATYYSWFGIDGILIRKLKRDDSAGECNLNSNQIVPGTQGKYPLLKAVSLGISNGVRRRVKYDRRRARGHNLGKRMTKANVMEHEKMVICQEIGLAQVLDVDSYLTNYCTHLIFKETLSNSPVTIEGLYLDIQTKIEENQAIIPAIQTIKYETNLKIILGIELPMNAIQNVGNTQDQIGDKISNLLLQKGFDGLSMSFTKYPMANYDSNANVTQNLYQSLKESNLLFFIQNKMCIKATPTFPDTIADFIILSCPIKFDNCKESSFTNNLEPNLEYAARQQINISKVIIRMSLVQDNLITSFAGNYRDVCNQYNRSIIQTVDRCNKELVIYSDKDNKAEEIVPLSDPGIIMKQTEYYSYHGVAGIMFDGYGFDDSHGECVTPGLTELNGPYPLLQGINKGIVRGDAMKKSEIN